LPPILRRRLAALLLVPAAVAAPALAGCGGGDESGGVEDVEHVLDVAFKQPVRSADVTINAQLAANGVESLRRPLRILASGPYSENRGRLPSFDIDLKIGAEGAGQTVSTGRLSTGDRTYVKFEDTFYELPRAEVERANREIRRDRTRRSALRGLGLDPRPWLLEARTRGEARVAGADTIHISGTLDTRELLRDLNRFVARASNTLGATAGDAPAPLRESDLDKLAAVIRNPSFDVYVGKRDRIIRRLAANLRFDVPERDRESLGGLEGGTIKFSVEFADVNGDQRVEAPARARPLADLTSQLGSAGALTGGLESELRDGLSGTETTPRQGGGGGEPGREEFERYAQCLDRARPEDTAALQRCADIVR
jgi:hypothetical protein